MSPLLTPLRAEVGGWIILFAGLIAGIGIESDWGQKTAWPIAAPEMAPAAFIKPALTEPYQLPAPDSFLETTLRPLFVPTRRPTPKLPDAPKQSMRKGQFLLAGTLIVGDTKFAQLIEKAGGKTHVIAEGKDINGIVIRQVAPTSVVLSQFDETEVVSLQPPQTAAAKAAAAGSGSPGQPVPPPPPGAPRP